MASYQFSSDIRPQGESTYPDEKYHHHTGFPLRIALDAQVDDFICL